MSGGGRSAPGSALSWCDAHLDLATLAVLGRDMHAEELSRAGGPWQPAAVTLPALRAGGVRRVLGTIFTEAGGTDAGVSYAEGDGEGALQAGLAQLMVYQEWVRAGHVRLWNPGAGKLAVLSKGGARASESPAQESQRAVLELGILMECADPIQTPDDLAWWAAQGVAAIGMAWARGSRYAGGNTQQHGLTDLGRVLVQRIDDAGLVHDQSHLSDRATDELLALSHGRVMASHSNCRALVDPAGANQRHLRDGTIRGICARGGVIGLNLYSKFLTRYPGRRATMDESLAHVEHVCMIAGSTRCVGLGSDMDGGLTAADLPVGVDTPSDLVRLADGLAARGWSDAEVRGFAWENWERFLRWE